MSDRLTMMTRMVTSLTEERVAIIKELERFGMRLEGSKIIAMGDHIRYAGVPARPGVIGDKPVMASGLKPDPLPPYSKKKIPIIAWYRLVFDPDTHDLEEAFNHYEDAVLTKVDPKNKKAIPEVIPPETNIPPKKGGTTFTGRWVWRIQHRTDELVPKVKR